jgi:hypothetical protein
MGPLRNACRGERGLSRSFFAEGTSCSPPIHPFEIEFANVGHTARRGGTAERVDRRGVIDTIIQSSTVELFHTYGAALAPLPRGYRSVADAQKLDLHGVITFSAPGFAGSLTLALPSAVLGLMQTEETRSRRDHDWVRELSNQLMGRVKNRLMQFQVTLQVGLPTVTNRDGVERRTSRSESVFIYCFRTIRGQVVVTLAGSIDESVIAYVGGINVASEGDIIIF